MKTVITNEELRKLLKDEIANETKLAREWRAKGNNILARVHLAEACRLTVLYCGGNRQNMSKDNTPLTVV